MADNSNRSYRGGEPYGRSVAGTAAARETVNDPLAELARLIGQKDPFADFNRDARPTAAPEPQPGGHDDWSSSYAEPDRYRAAPAAESQSAPQYRDEPLVERPFPGTAPRYDDRGYDAADDERSDYDDRAPQHRQPAAFAAEPPHGYDDEERDDRRDYDTHDARDETDGATNGYPSEEFYDDAPSRRRRSGLVVVMAVLGLAVVGTAGAFAYRSMFGGAMLPSLPPIIKANGTPTKVVPPVQTADAGKTPDRTAGAEQVVSREEQPVELKGPTRSVAPRVISTIPVAPTGSAPAFPSPPAAVPPAAAASPFPTPGAAPEPQPSTVAPRKIRTVTIRPDQAGGGAAAPAPLAPSRTAPIRAAAPRPAPPQGAPTGNEPLALVPTTGQAEAPAAPAPHGRTRTALAHPAAPERAAPAAGGGYTVQVSSQHSEAEAQTAFKSLQSRFPDQLGGRGMSVRRADLGNKGVYYRAMVGPFASMEEAAGMCSSLKAAGGSCIVQRN